ncbi:MAG TPA: isochorismate synthase [Beutenbergiaceae bacterium]|nr:isochorismate synthase [Beutenbergiaceae bacterium]
MSTRPSPAAQPLVARTVAIDDPGDLLDLLPSPNPAHTLAWVREGKGIIGIGQTMRIDSHGPTRFTMADEQFAAIASQAVIRDDVRRPGTGPIGFGSFAFSRHSPAGGSLIIPELVVGRDDDAAWVTRIGHTLEPVPTLAQIRELASELLPPSLPEFRGGSLARAQWLAEVEKVMERIQSGEADKVVVARDLFAHLPAPGDARRVVDRLSEEYPTCWTFAVDGFFGATPELLVRRHRGLISSRVLAGTIQRGTSPDQDAQRAAALAQDSKERLEHAYAVQSLIESLKPYAASFSVPDAPFILHLPNVMHLATDVTAAPTADAREVSSLALAETFHPTAAVCGTPTQVAASILAEHERLDRHRYAGPVGWIGADGDGEWGIALRSGRALDDITWQIFAGCGIMSDSRPEAEWAETEAKFAPMRAALSHG